MLTRIHPRPLSEVQLDLFGEIEAAESAAEAKAADVRHQAHEFLTCEPWTDLLEWLLNPDRVEADLTHGETKAHLGKRYAYAIWRDGLRFEQRDEWSLRGGWNCRPRHVIPWAELHALVDARPDLLAEIQRLAQGRLVQVGWRWRMRPFILTIGGWHSSYLESERSDDYYSHDGHALDVRTENAYADRLWAWYHAVEIISGYAIAVKRGPS